MVSKLQLFDDLCRGPLWLGGAESKVRIMGASIKVEPTGYLVIIRGITAEGPKVAFVGVGSMEKVYRALVDIDSLPLERWKEDKFALDRKGT